MSTETVTLVLTTEERQVVRQALKHTLKDVQKVRRSLAAGFSLTMEDADTLHNNGEWTTLERLIEEVEDAV